MSVKALELPINLPQNRKGGGETFVETGEDEV